MQELNPTLRDEMRNKAREIRERQAAGANFRSSWSLTGAKAIVAPGRDVVVRLAPRWDFDDSLLPRDPATGRRAPNPAYKFDLKQYVEAWEHWWQVEGGTWAHEWCPLPPPAGKSQCACPIGVASAVQLASPAKDDKALGNRWKAKQVFIFNAFVGDPRLLGQDGLVDIRDIALPATLYNAVSDIMTGGEKEQFRRGDITNPRDGYDLLFKRPMGGGAAWVADCAPSPSPLYRPEQAAAFKEWTVRLINLEEMLKKDTKDLAGVFKAFYGRDPALGELGGDSKRQGPRSTAPAATTMPGGSQEPPDRTVEESAAPPEGPDDEFMSLMPPAGGGQSRPVSPANDAARTAARSPRR